MNLPDGVHDTLLHLGIGILLAQGVLLATSYTGVYSAGTVDEFVVGIVFALFLIVGSASPLLLRKVVRWSA